MERQGNDIGKVKALIGTLRKITQVVQLAPFIYTGLYILVLISYLFAQDNVLNVLDLIFYVSPVVTLIFLLESRVLKLCAWHRAACVLPVIPQIVSLVDSVFIEFTVYEAAIFNGMLLLMSVLLLIAAYKVFFCKQ